jgi:hypothetical protein
MLAVRLMPPAYVKPYVHTWHLAGAAQSEMINYRGVSRCSCDIRRAIEITTHRETTPTQIHKKSEIIWSFSDTTLRHQTFKRSELKDRTTVGGDTSEFVRRILSMPLAVSSRNFQAQHSSRPARILCQSSASRGPLQVTSPNRHHRTSKPPQSAGSD